MSESRGKLIFFRQIEKFNFAVEKHPLEEKTHYSYRRLYQEILMNNSIIKYFVPLREKTKIKDL